MLKQAKNVFAWLFSRLYCTFFTDHPMLAMLVLPIVGLGAGAVLANVRGHRGWYSLIIPFYLFSQINFFTSHILNALFLNAFGTTGSAVIVHSQETNSQLNDQYIWDYDAVLKTADGRDVVIRFNTMSASIYPIRNRILIPPENEPFVAKYIDSFRGFSALSVPL
jgi:hypothetical protein